MRTTKKLHDLAAIALAIVLAIACAGCANTAGVDPVILELTSPNPSASGAAGTESAAQEPDFPQEEGTVAEDPATILAQDIYTTAYEYADEDTSGEPAGAVTTVVFNGNTAQVSGAGALFSGGTLTINKAGTYELSGTLTNGQILINATKNDLVQLSLNGVSLHNETGPAIYAPQAGKVVLILTENTQNTISDGSTYPPSSSESNPDAAIYVQDDLSITGGGQLTVSGNYKHGIRTQDHLVITDGVLHITAIGDALRGRDGVTIQDGVFTLTAGGDGIQSNNATGDDVGYVIINGGAFTIRATNDGIQAESALTITGGTFDILTGGGSANAPVRVEDFRGFPGQTISTAEEASASMKALKAGKQLYITGGHITIDAEDDAIHSNGGVHITAGVLSIKTGDDGIHADAATVISGGDISIPVCYEGIEGLSVTITGGNIIITAGDDAINAAGGVDSVAPGGPMGGDRFAVNGDIFIRIAGGTLDLSAPHDGIDANGDIFLEGGTVKISGPSMGMDGAIDLDGTLLITGGELITAGSVLNVSASSTQPTLLVSYAQPYAAGSVIMIADASGNAVLSYTSTISFYMSGFTSAAFIAGETYTLYVNGEKKTDVVLGSGVTSLADDGGVYNGGMGGGRGNWGGGMPPGRQR